jgi:probable DNA repair protein
MGAKLAVETDAWLRGGGVIVAASERAARTLIAAFHRARIEEGLAAWPAPKILDWHHFVRKEWEERSRDQRLVLSPLQEQSLWAEMVSQAAPQAAQIEGSRQRLAAMAMDAHALLCAYAPHLLAAPVRRGWTQDAAEFSAWLTAFDWACHDGEAISAARLPLALAAILKEDSTPRPPLLLAGFDRILPAQRSVFEAWGQVREAERGETATKMRFYITADPTAELAACALWCQQQLAKNPDARLLIIAQSVRQRRGEIERALLRYSHSAKNPSPAVNLFEFSLGVPLGQVGLARGALLLLRWLTEPIEEHQLDWFFSTGQTAASDDESRALTAFQRALRRRNLQRAQWPLAIFLEQKPGAELPAAWAARLMQAQRFLDEFARRPQTPLACAEFVPRLLELAGWPGARPLTSAEFQALRLWRQTLDNCAALGFYGRRVAWSAFLAVLQQAAGETLFSAESQQAPILIAGPSESAGITADAIWFLGADEESWSAPGTTNPLLPLAVEREAGMPHATPQLDWDLAEATTRRLLASAPAIHFSYARQNKGVDARPSRIIAQIAGGPQPLPAELKPQPAPAPLTVSFSDAGKIPFPADRSAGGANVLTAQSQCPFKAFATSRLGAEDWTPAETGLTAAERGLLLHAVLHSIWSGLPNGIRTHEQLAAISNLLPFVLRHAREVLRSKLPARARECMPPRYLQLEETRLAELVSEWLRYESARVPFAVEATEQKRTTAIAGLQLRLRLDRIDRLCDDSLLVIDYKSGDAQPGDWELPRPNDVQLPLYAGFALDHETEPVGGLVLAKIRAGEDNCEFAGRVFDPQTTIFGELKGTSSLVKNKLTIDQLEQWRKCIEQLARDFLAGRAEVDPRENPKTCERCGLQALCRILDQAARSEAEESEEAVDD